MLLNPFPQIFFKKLYLDRVSALPHALWFVWNPKAFHKILSFHYVRSSLWFNLTCCAPVNCCFWPCVFQLFRKGDGKGMILQCCKAALLQVFMVPTFLMFSHTRWKNVFLLPRKYWFFRSVLLMNQFAKVGCPEELGSRKLWFLPVAAGGPGAALSVCVCAIPPLAQGTALPGRRSQSGACANKVGGF